MPSGILLGPLSHQKKTVGWILPKKSSQGASKQRKSEFLKILQNSWFFNGFPCFLRGARRLFCYVFLWNVSNCEYSMRISKKMWPDCLRNQRSKQWELQIFQYDLPIQPLGIPLGLILGPLGHQNSTVGSILKRKNAPENIKTRKTLISGNRWETLVFQWFSMLLRVREVSFLFFFTKCYQKSISNKQKQKKIVQLA